MRFLCSPLTAEQLPESANIPAGVRNSHQHFWRCSRCGHIYWQGAQYDSAVGRLTRDLERLSAR